MNGPYISVAAIKSGARHRANIPAEWLISPWRIFKAADKTISVSWQQQPVTRALFQVLK